MAELVQRRTTVTNPLVGLVIAASLFGGIAGGAVAIITLPAAIQARVDDEAAQAAERAKWLQYGQEWEARYRQMYPISE
jgi:hypothetical protein